VVCSFLAWITLQLWSWRGNIPPKRLLTLTGTILLCIQGGRTIYLISSRKIEMIYYSDEWIELYWPTQRYVAENRILQYQQWRNMPSLNKLIFLDAKFEMRRHFSFVATSETVNRYSVWFWCLFWNMPVTTVLCIDSTATAYRRLL
jgi:hypothetical protein